MLDGREALEGVLRRAGRTVLAAVAEQTVFLHPETVEQTNGEALFPIARDPARRGCIVELDGRRLMMDDNTSPTLAFEWAAQQKKGPDVQFNHIYKGADNPDIYTALWNICVTPAFLAKLTDAHDDVVAALKFRSFDLYGCLPRGEAQPEPPDGYDDVEWRGHPAPVSDLESVLRGQLTRASRSRPAQASREIGWYFSRWEPDPTLPNPASTRVPIASDRLSKSPLGLLGPGSPDQRGSKTSSGITTSQVSFLRRWWYCGSERSRLQVVIARTVALAQRMARGDSNLLARVPTTPPS